MHKPWGYKRTGHRISDDGSPYGWRSSTDVLEDSPGRFRRTGKIKTRTLEIFLNSLLILYFNIVYQLNNAIHLNQRL
jgi:hypothetical protein